MIVAQEEDRPDKRIDQLVRPEVSQSEIGWLVVRPEMIAHPVSKVPILLILMGLGDRRRNCLGR